MELGAPSAFFEAAASGVPVWWGRGWEDGTAPVFWPEEHPEAGRHLAAALRMCTYCTYARATTVEWET
jgi:hypothetical protein